MSHQTFGAAIGDGFVLNEATLMIGALGQALDLTEEEHSVGLFKNLVISQEKTYQPLTHGVRQDIVDQQLTGDNWTISGNGYEYNPRTIMYALGQSGYTADPLAERVKLTVTAPASVGEETITVESATGITAGDWIVLNSTLGGTDGLAYQVKTVEASVVTLDRPLVSAVATGDKLVKSSLILTNDPDSCSSVSYHSAKIVSADVHCNPIVIVVPKLQITSGLNLAFGTSDYSSMAFQGTAMASTRRDASYDLYRQNGSSKVFLIT